jgi:hypothetical protein
VRRARGAKGRCRGEGSRVGRRADGPGMTLGRAGGSDQGVLADRALFLTGPKSYDFSEFVRGAMMTRSEDIRGCSEMMHGTIIK